MNRIFFALVLVAFAFAAWFQMTWSPPESEGGAAQTALTDGMVVVVGYSGAAAFHGEGWGRFPMPATVRRGAALAPLPKGGALLIGGLSAPRGIFSTARRLVGAEGLGPSFLVERFDPIRLKWEEADRLPQAVVSPMTVSLEDGSVVVLGGHDGERPVADVFRFDPPAGMWERLPPMPDPRAQAVVSRMGRDWVVVGGLTEGNVPALTTLVYRSDDRAWHTAPGPRMPRLGHAVVPSPQGGLLLIGGENPDLGSLPTVEWFDPVTLSWRIAGQLEDDRIGAMVAVSDGAVVVGGGRDIRDVELKSAEIRMAGKWGPLKDLPEPRTGGVGHRVKGKVAFVGGSRFGADVLDLDRGVWRTIKPTSPMESLGMSVIDSAGSAVTLAISLIGVMTLFLGLMKVGEAGGLLSILAKLIRPMMIRLFPDVPPDHPAMGAMIMNMSANALGLGNAATPFGIRAMEELDKLNETKGTATNAMVLFLAINTSNVTILPTGVIALRAATGSADPGGILVTTLFATLCSTTVAIVASKLMQRFSPVGAGVSSEDGSVEPAAEAQDAALPDEASAAYPGWVSALALVALFSVIPLALIPTTRGAVEASVPWLIPVIVLGLLAFGFFRGVPVYETFVGGARDGFQVAVRIIPFLVGILVAIGMFKGSGALEAFVSIVGPITSAVGLPGEALPMALLRPLSGSGAYGVLVSIIADPAIGPDSYTGYLVSIFQGSTETTFYVLAVYFGAVGIKRLRHAMFAALSADLAGVIAAVVICSLLFGGGS
jgi:spore maturation protein SpmA/N-acetylneuraminic acid mutarotase